MKTRLVNISTTFLLLFSIMSFAQNTERVKTGIHQQFFNEADASNWVYVIKNKSKAPSDVFKMKNGVLKVTGVSDGYLRTKKSYSNYTLELEWRWTKSVGNSGVFAHIQPGDTIWPICYEVQQKAGDAGDIICLKGLKALECIDPVKNTVKKFQPTNEKALGEWNTMRIICKKNTMVVYVNGELQNSINGLTATKGFIGFQSEGFPFEIQNLSIQ